MPRLSRELNCLGCGSLDHKTSVCPRILRVDRSPAATAKLAKSKAAGASIPAATKLAKSKAAGAGIPAEAAAVKKAAAVAARKLTCQVKRAARANIEAVNRAAYEALAAVMPIPATASSYRAGYWSVAADVCETCNRPSKGCMCVF